jgi:hypothetical protein
MAKQNNSPYFGFLIISKKKQTTAKKLQKFSFKKLYIEDNLCFNLKKVQAKLQNRGIN